MLFAALTFIAVGSVYVRGWYRLLDAIPDLLSAWRLTAFLCGLFALWVVVASPLAAMDHHLLTAHMAQHLILMTVSAPLILLGAPVIVLLNGLPKSVERLVSGSLLGRSPVQGFRRVITHPVFCWFAGAITVVAWHIPAFFELGMRSARWHEVEYACFFAAGILFWWPVVQPWPSLAKWSTWGVPLYLFLATLPCDALSAFLTFCGRVVYPHYGSVHGAFNISPLFTPLGDQACAGALMWVWVTFVYLAPAAVVTVRTLSPQRRALNAELV
jgi:cytochrome c oxidase assembly factor CtaG